MPKSSFDRILRKHEDDLHRIRSRFFPLIERSLITGYNLYPKPFNYSYGELFLNYLHPSVGGRNQHFKELSQRLRNEGLIDLEKRIVISNRLVDRSETLEREADYVTLPDWEDPLGMRYFAFTGEELSRQEAKRLNERVIGESVQHDLIIRVKNQIELRKLVNLFKKYTSEVKLDRYGNRVLRLGLREKNEDAISGAQKIPLLVCASKNERKPHNLYDFLTVTHFSIDEKIGRLSVVLSTLVRSKAKVIKSILEEDGIAYKTSKKYALRVFAEEYVENP